MTRTTASVTLDLEEDKAYKGTLRKPADGPWIQTTKDGPYAGQKQLVMDWELNMDAGRVRDWVSIKLGNNVTTGKPSKLRQVLNAIGERAPDDEVWFDPDTLEWGYNMEDGSPAYAKLTEGMEVMFKGEYRKNARGGRRYAVTAYKRFMAGAATNGRLRDGVAASPPVDVDPDDIPF